MLFKLYLTFIAVFFLSLCSYAQNNDYQFSHLDIRNGLSNNRILCIYKDEDGFMWFGTTTGLNRFDGYDFKIYKHDAADPESLAANYVTQINEGPGKKLWIYTNNGISIYDPATEKFANGMAVIAELTRYHVFADHITAIKKDQQGNFWFITDNKGLYCFNPTTNQTFFLKTSQSDIKLHSNYVAEIANEQKNVYWLIYGDGIIDKINIATKKVLFRSYKLYNENGGKLLSYGGILANDHNLWLYVSERPLGIYCYQTATDKLEHYVKGGSGISLNSNVINDIVEGNNKNIWVGTDHGGINIIEPAIAKVDYVVNHDDDPKSLSGNSVVLYKDNTGIIWAGTFKQGLSYYHKNIIQFPLVRHYILDKTSLPYEDVDCFTEDDKGNLWIGTNGGGIIFFDKQTKKYTQFKHDPANPGSLSNDIVVSLLIDHEHNLWAGTYFGGLNYLVNGKFIHYTHKESDPRSLSDDRVYTIIEDSYKNLWVGTFAGGLNIFDRQKKNFTHPLYQMSSEYTSIIYEDKQKNIWIGHDNGVDVIDRNTNIVKNYYYQPQKSSLIANDVNTIMQDHRGLIWIGTKEGLSMLNTSDGKFINIGEKDGLPSNNVLSIKEDNNGRIWLDGANGLASINLIKNTANYAFEIHKYDEFDGLQGNEFNANASLKLENGDLIFGGAHGFNLFNPQKINSIGIKSQLLFTDFELYNKTVGVGDTIDGKVVLNQSITQSKSIVLNHNQNVFSISFSVCDYFSPNKIVYQYKLDGFDKVWLTAEHNTRKATYTNLDAGNYVFRVRAKDINNPANTSNLSMEIEILPPFWKSKTAYLLYIIFIIGLLFYIRSRGINKLKREFKVTQDKLEAERNLTKEREEANRMHELDLMKIKFFTNVSHEFRTPLSLIISPIESMIKNSNNVELKGQLLMVKRNGKRLLNLVNQLLDFRKMESKELKLNLEKDDIVEFIKDVSFSFNDLAEQNGINYVFESDINSLITKFDHDKIERILFNLLSNAFKFTASGGNISVLLGLTNAATTVNDSRLLEIKIVDTGIGISEEKREKIFERFFQVELPENLLNQGSGIGLSITHEFVKMHKGEISVESEPGNGTCFIIYLPINIEDDAVISSLPVNQVSLAVVTAEQSTAPTKKLVILLVEDNDDMRFYLKDNLKHMFTVVEAVNGKEGWQKALALHPNLIVSDVSMPEMNGINLCKKVRSDSRTAHIPIILLTALTEEADQLAGLSNGANDYITKPFNVEILVSKINGLLAMQQSLKKTYQKQMGINVQDMVIVSEDEKFLKNTFDCIEKNITNYNFSVEELSRQMTLSRVSLYKRLLALTGKTPVDCIRTVRLKKAVQLLEKSQLTIASIAYEVGFNNPTYFSKVFKDEYGTVPSEYILTVRKKEVEVN